MNRNSDDPGRVAFLFPSQRGQWNSIGKDLFEDNEPFRLALQACDEVVQRRLKRSFVPALADTSDHPTEHGDLVQPLVTSIQIGLAEALMHEGLVPDAVVGLSMGELAAAYASGSLTIEEAMNVACAEALAVRYVPRSGQMALIVATRAQAEGLIPHGSNAWVAVELSPTVTIISGEERTIDDVLAMCLSKGISCIPRTMDFAFHTKEMAPVRAGFFKASPELSPHRSKVVTYSSVTGEVVDGTSLTMEYWWRVMSEPSLFSSGITSMIGDGIRMFIEIGPEPMLAEAVAEIARAAGVSAVGVHTTTTRDGGGLGSLRATLRAFHGHQQPPAT